MSEKSPFELRMEMIEVARGMLEKQFELNREIAMTSWNFAVEAAKAIQGAIPEAPKLTYPTFEEVKALAEKMNVFVSGK